MINILLGKHEDEKQKQLRLVGESTRTLSNFFLMVDEMQTPVSSRSHTRFIFCDFLIQRKEKNIVKGLRWRTEEGHLVHFVACDKKTANFEKEEILPILYCPILTFVDVQRWRL